MTTVPITRHDDLDFARLLTFVERAVVLRLTEVLRSDGATIEEWRVLTLLADGAGHTMSEIAEFATMLAPTLTKVVDRMVSGNLVIRRADDIDRRRVLVFASDRGHHAFARWTAMVKVDHDDLVSTIGGEEFALLRALLVRASGRLS